MESNVENNLESLMKTQMGYDDFSKCCGSCTYHESGKCYLNPVKKITVASNACCNFWKELIPVDIDKIIGEETLSDSDRVGPDITPEGDMLKS